MSRVGTDPRVVPESSRRNSVDRCLLDDTLSLETSLDETPSSGATDETPSLGAS